MNFSILSNEVYERDPLWQPQVAVVLAIVLQLLLPDRLLGNARFVLVGVEALLLIGLAATTPRTPNFHSAVRRASAIGLIALTTLANIATLERLAHLLLVGGKITNGHELILAAINVFITNVIIFGLWYWEIDGGGPGRRRGMKNKDRDFVFTQMSTPELAKKNWEPTFIDYIYLSLTNATAFSPTDTMPITERAKLLMAIQSIVSLITIALVAARAVNILG